MGKTTKNRDKLGWRGLGATMVVQMLLIAYIPLAIVSTAVIVSQDKSIKTLETGMLAARQDMTAELGEDLQGKAQATLHAILTHMDERIQDVTEWTFAPILRQAARDAAARVTELGMAELNVDEIETQMSETRRLNDLARTLAEIVEQYQL